MKKHLLSSLGILLILLTLIGCSTNSLDNVQYDLAREFIESQNKDKEQKEKNQEQNTDEVQENNNSGDNSSLDILHKEESSKSNYTSDNDLGLQEVVVKKVIDGDTFVTADNEKIRLIGVNTPESTTIIEEYGKEASDYAKSVLTGKTVYLQKDTSETDIYGRSLRIVWLEVPSSTQDLSEIKTKMFNAALVINGYAQASTYEPDVKYSELFRELSRQARIDKKGLWKISENGTTKGDSI